MPRRPAAKDEDAQPDQPEEAAQQADTSVTDVHAELEEQTATIRRAAARIAARVPDEDLDDLPDLELLEEARRRGITFTRSVTRQQIIAAAQAAVAE